MLERQQRERGRNHGRRAQAHKRAVLVGETTYGKASVQNVIKLALRPDCAVRLTTGYYYTPDDLMIHGKGITPDVTVPVSKHVWRQVQMRRMLEERRAQRAAV